MPANNFRLAKIEKVIESMEAKRLLLSQNVEYIKLNGSQETVDMTIGQIIELTFWLDQIRKEFGIDDN
jgi:hypothetical protein